MFDTDHAGSIAVITLGSAAAVWSSILVGLALLDMAGIQPWRNICGYHTFGIVHTLGFGLQAGVFSVGMWLLVDHGAHYAIAFVVSGSIFLLLHMLLLAWRYIICCGEVCMLGRPLQDTTQSALLTVSSGGRTLPSSTSNPSTTSGGGSAHAGAVPPARGSPASNNAAARASGGGGGASEDSVRNPFRSTYGFLPGTHTMAYQIFLPDMEEAAQTAPYTGLQSGPDRRSEGRGQHKEQRGGRV